MRHQVSMEDVEYKRAFEACEISPGDFDHRAHVRVAYIYLCDQDVEGAVARMTGSLQALLKHYAVDPMKYHATLTRAWILAVDYFMQEMASACQSAADFIRSNPLLLDSKIMLTHYSAEVLFSKDARRAFVQPDIQSIPPR